jgi:uncharacterized iron-regulated membrane protein
MKQIMELVGGLVILFGGLSTLSMFGLQGTQGTQAVQSMAVGSPPKKVVQVIQRVEVGEGQVNLQTKTTEEYYNYKEEEEELWEKMKAYYKDYAGGGIDEQHN